MHLQEYVYRFDHTVLDMSGAGNWRAHRGNWARLQVCAAIMSATYDFVGARDINQGAEKRDEVATCACRTADYRRLTTLGRILHWYEHDVLTTPRGCKRTSNDRLLAYIGHVMRCQTRKTNALVRAVV